MSPEYFAAGMMPAEYYNAVIGVHILLIVVVMFIIDMILLVVLYVRKWWYAVGFRCRSHHDASTRNSSMVSSLFVISFVPFVCR